MQSGRARARRTASAVVAAFVLGATLSTAAPARAGFHSPRDFNRAQVALRANAWVKDRVPYSQTRWYNGYRQDCSGYVSMVWSLGKSYVTWTLPQVAWPIRKSDLTLGDIMLDQTGGSQHVVIFDRWANAAHTAYWEWELAGSTGRPVHRVVPYPFWTGDRDDYKPYRFAVSPRYTGKQPPKPAAVKTVPSNVATPSITPTRTPVQKPKEPIASHPRNAPTAARGGQAAPKAGGIPKAPTPEPQQKAAAPVSAPAASRAGRTASAEKPPKEHVVVTLLRMLVAWLAE